MNINPIIKLPVAELKTAIGGISKVLPRHSTLPVLGMIHIQRDRQGWVYLSATDLDTFLTLRLEAPGQERQSGEVPGSFLRVAEAGQELPRR
jgi:DNA polymerase III sliding clamp (beta) subunit (PCNA family)